MHSASEVSVWKNCSEPSPCRAWEDGGFPGAMDLVCKTSVSTGRGVALIHLMSLEQLPCFPEMGSFQL